LAAFIAVAACGSDAPATCGTAGSTQACLCAGGASGAQPCLASGAWGACACGTTEDAAGGEVDAVASGDASDTATTGGPAVISRTPSEDATGVAPNVVITVTFDAPLAPTPAGSWATLHEGDASVAVALSVDGSVLRIAPQATLRTDTTYTVALTTAVAAADGRQLGASESWSFTTAGPVRIISVSPAGGATNVPIGASIEITFSKPLASHGSIVLDPPASYNFIVKDETTSALALLPGTPPALREYETSYEIRLTGDYVATDGAPLEPWSASFRTVFFDSGYYYKLHVERDDALTALDNYADGQRYAYMTAANTTGSHWWLAREGDWLLLGSEFGGDNLVLRAQPGSEAARLTPASFDDEQRWRLVKYNPRTVSQGDGQSPHNYYLESKAHGAPRTLGTTWNEAAGVYDVLMQDRSGNVGHLWWAARYGPRPE